MLAYTSLHAPGAEPTRSVVFLHGILGDGSNWQGFAKRLTAALPEWRAVLVDLRMHGDSQSQPGPHTLAAAATDVIEVMRVVGDVRAVIGHSFGGKVALSLLAQPLGALSSLAQPPAALDCIWALDSSPSMRTDRDPRELTSRVLGVLNALPAAFADRNRFIAELEQHGIAPAIARWLAKNLRRDAVAADGAAGGAATTPGLLRFGLDLGAIGELLADYDRTDLWPLMENPDRAVELCFVLAGRDSVVSPSDRARLHAFAQRSLIALHELPDAGHFLHVDDPDGLLALVVAGLR